MLLVDRVERFDASSSTNLTATFGPSTLESSTVLSSGTTGKDGEDFFFPPRRVTIDDGTPGDGFESVSVVFDDDDVKCCFCIESPSSSSISESTG